MALKLRDLVARLRIVFDKQAQQQSEESVKGGFDRITDMAKKVGVAIAAAFAVERVIAFGKAAFRAAVEAEIPWKRLANTVENAGVSFRNVEARIKLAAAAMQATTRVGDEEFAQMLDELTAKTGDFELAFKNIQLTANVAAKFFEGNLQPAIDLVARALSGQTRSLREVGIITKDVNEGLRILAERSAGAAENELQTLSGQLKAVSNDFGDFMEELGGLISDIGSSTGIFSWLRETIQEITELLRKIRETREETTERQRAALHEDERQELQRKGLFLPPPPKPKPPTPEMIEAANKAAAELIKKNLEEWEAGAVLPGLIVTVPGGGKLAARPPGVVGEGITRGGFPDRQMTGADLILHGDTVQRVRDGFADIEAAGTNAAFGIVGAFQDTFAVLIDEFGNVGAAAEALGRGITGSLLGGVAQYASAKVKENVALSFEEVAKGIAALANPFLAATAPAHFTAAAKHAGVAGLWGVLAGGAGAGQSAVAGGGRGGLSGGIPAGASDIGSRLIEGKGPQTIIYIDGFQPNNPVHVRLLGQGIRKLSETDSSVDVRPRPR